ncbi:MAG: RIP metalloprotease RseP, partial [Chloroflexota bacterium]|nr:RIP metalloprotease RseP [Chloroflexota bacterium]
APILLAGVTMNLILAFLVFAFIAFVMPPYVSVVTTRISQVDADTPAAEVGLRPGDVVTAVNGQDVTNRLETLQQLIGQNAGRAVTLTIVRNGKALAPIAVAPRVLAANTPARLGIALDVPRGLEVMAVEPDSVAARAGVRPGDVLIFVSDPRGQTLIDQNDLVKFTTTHAGFKIEWRIGRDGKLLDPITVQIPAEVTTPNAALGLRLYNTPLDASARSIEEMWTMVASLPRVFSQLLSGSVPPNSFVGPIGIAQVTGEVAQRAGFIGLLNLLGLLSVNLAVVNLFPLPGLDGGRLIFVLLEWVRGGKKINPQKEGMVHLVGIAVLLGLMLIISFFDVQRLISGQSIFP